MVFSQMYNRGYRIHISCSRSAAGYAVPCRRSRIAKQRILKYQGFKRFCRICRIIYCHKFQNNVFDPSSLVIHAIEYPTELIYSFRRQELQKKTCSWDSWPQNHLNCSLGWNSSVLVLTSQNFPSQFELIKQEIFYFSL